jgi:hypothetical protein
VETDFSADCRNCYALCCTALSFQRGTQFAHDKLAGHPCHHLAGDFRCSIHSRLEELNYPGCTAFDCLGAGQRASAIYADSDWRNDPKMANRLFASFSLLLRIQEMRRALETAADLDIRPTLHEERMALLATLSSQGDSRREDVVEAASRTLKECRAFLKRLASELTA